MHKCLILTGNEVHHNFLANSLIKNCKNFNFTIIKTNSGKNDFEFFYPFLSRGIKNKNKEKILDYLFLRNKTLCMNENFNLLISPKNEVILKDSKHLHNYLEKFLKNKTFDIVITYGSPIIKNKKILKFKSFNIHHGLSRFFRGGTSNITALASNNLDKVGITCHELKPLIDSGNVLFEIRKIPLSKLKSIDELNYFLLKESIKKLIGIFNKFKFDTYSIPSGKLISNKSFTGEILIKAESNLKNFQGNLK